MDWVEVYLGNRGMNRQGVYELYDAPLHIQLDVEEALTGPAILTSETGWEGSGMILPLTLWQHGRLRMAATGPGSGRVW